MRILIPFLSLLALSPAAYAQTSALVSIGSGGRLQYQPFANWGQSNADNVVPDFSAAGYVGGGVPLPVIPAVETVDPVTGDARAVIQAAIDRVSALPKDLNGFRGAILLKSGRYYVEGSLVLRADGVVLRGEGQNTPEHGGTEIIATAQVQHTLIRLVGSETATGSSSEVVLDSKLYPPQYTIAEYDVLSGVAEELEGDRTISFHVFTNANQYTHYGSREDAEFRRPVLELTTSSSVPGEDTVVAYWPVADAYVRGGVDSLHNFGADSSLPIKYSGEGAANTREGFLKFNLSSITDTLKAAKLKLYAKYDLTRPDVTVPVLTHFVSVVSDDSWDEMTITYANRPRPAATNAVKRIATTYVPSGATMFTLSDVTGLTVGDSIKIVRTPNDTWINTLDMAQYGWIAANYRTKYERVITAIDGSTITINVPVVQAMEDQFGGGEVYKETVHGRLVNCGVESMLLTSVYASDIDEQHGWNGISLTQTAHCWVQNVTARYFGYACVMLDWAFNTTVQNCAMLDPKSITTGGRTCSC